MVKKCYMYANSTHSPFITIGGNIEGRLLPRKHQGEAPAFLLRSLER